MNKINFGIISEPMTYLDTDKMSIGRKVQIINPDGTIGETDPKTPIYENIPCHISFVQSDNPDATSVDTKPIITGLKINCSLDVDLQNNDYLIAYKLDNNGNILETYKGVIGYPTVTESRKSVEMEMKVNV